jgi:phage terminase small subunit
MEPPPELDGDCVARAEWRRLAPMLMAARLVTVADRQPLIAACLEWSVYVRANRLSRRGDMTVNAVPAVAASRRRLPSRIARCNRCWSDDGTASDLRFG